MADAAKTKKVAKPASHPKYSEMINNAITSLKERKGSSRVAIVKYITTKYMVQAKPNVVNSQVKMSLRKGVTDGVFVQVKGTGASGSFRLAKAAPKPKQTPTKKPTKKVVKPKVPKTAKKTKAVAKKKPVAKKSPKKATKKVAKKPAAKKPAVKKPKTTKPKVKKAAKKAAKK